MVESGRTSFDKMNSQIMKKSYRKFIRDMKNADIECEDYRGRSFYHGPAVRTHEEGFPTLQDVIRLTSVRLQWDNLGFDFIVYPV